MAEYYVIRDKNTGLYFRGKGANRWGKYYNQASVYRIKKNAENAIKEVAWHGEQAEVVPIQIIESTSDVVPKSKYDLAVAEREANVKGFAEELAKTKAEVAREFAKYLIDHSQDGAVMISDLPDLVVGFTKGADNE